MMKKVVPFFERIEEKSEDQDLGDGCDFPTHCFQNIKIIYTDILKIKGCLRNSNMSLGIDLEFRRRS